MSKNVEKCASSRKKRENGISPKPILATTTTLFYDHFSREFAKTRRRLDYAYQRGRRKEKNEVVNRFQH